MIGLVAGRRSGVKRGKSRSAHTYGRADQTGCQWAISGHARLCDCIAVEDGYAQRVLPASRLPQPPTHPTKTRATRLIPSKIDAQHNA